MINGASKREREQPVGSQRWDEVLQHAFVGKQVDATKPWIDQNQVIMPSDGPSAFTKEERLIQTLALKSLCCWGGDYFNVGEGYISELLMRSSSSLEMVIFNPSATKGGILVRPLYSNSDREGTLEFPSLKILGVTSRVHSIPLDFGWKTPNLETLVVFVHFNYWSQWQAQELRDQLVASCPRLERIVICDTKFLHSKCRCSTWEQH
jgi:hypothetical protein